MTVQAVIETGGKQYLVSAGEKVLVGNLEGEAGAEIAFDRVLLVHGEQTSVGTPYVNGAKVTGKIVAQEKGDKIVIYTYKRRKGYHKKKGHRQQLTRVEITAIQS